MNAEALLEGLEPLTHSDRIRRMVELGKKARAGDAEARELIAALGASPEAYARSLALMTAHGSRDGARVLASVSDPSRTVRGEAIVLVPLVCNDAQAEEALSRAVGSRSVRRLVLGLHDRRRPAPIDAFLEKRLAAAREPQIVDLLPLGSAALVERHLGVLDAAGSRLAWDRLAAFHPAIAGRAIEDRIAGSASLDPRQRYLLLPAVAIVARWAPDAAIRVVRALFDRGEEPSSLADVLRMLVAKRPRETFDLLRARHESGRPTRPPGAFGVVRFGRVAHRLGVERLGYLITRAWSTLPDGLRARRWFLHLSAEERAEILSTWLAHGDGAWGAFLLRHIGAADAERREKGYQRWSHAARSSGGVISPAMLDALPRDLREREAKRHLYDVAHLASKPAERTAYARFLPFPEAKSFLQPWLGHPEGEERARALGVLIACAFHEPAALADILAVVRARKNDQDPVRLAMVQALGALPVTRYSAAHLEAAGGVVGEALDAADLSAATAAAVERLVARLFRIDGGWGARWLARILEVRGSVSMWGLGDGLTGPEARALSPAIAALAERWATRERAGSIIGLAQSLGVRLCEVAPLLDALERLARELPFVGVAAISLDLLRKRARTRLARLVPELLALDRSFSLLPVVARFVSLKRQDLLGGLLERAPMTGRFATGRAHWVIDFEVGFARWTVLGQRTYAGALAALLREPDRDVPTLRFALARLVRLPFADATAILPFAADPRPPVREIAVRGLPWLDAGQGIATLLDCLGDDRARYAIYALRKVFAEMSRARVLEVLRAVPTGKVTVAKEVVRLLGEMGGASAFGEIVALARPGVHRDVRIAVMRALWDHLERPETWEVFERAAADPDWIVASRLADVPVGRLSEATEERVVGLFAQILARREPEARLDLLKRAAFVPLRDARRALFRRLVAHMGTDHPDEAAAALRAVLSRMNPDEVDVVVGRLRELLPRRRLLLAFLPQIWAHTGPYAAKHHVRVAEGLLDALRLDVLAVPKYVDLAGRLLGWRELGRVLVDLSERDLLHADAMVAALGATAACVHPEPLEGDLAARPDPRLRRLALEALDRAATTWGWTAERKGRLEAFRRDPSPLVAGAASFVLTPE